MAKDDWSGRSVGNAGDVNGDGFDDVIIGAPLADPNSRAGAGSSYVVFGKASGFSAVQNLSDLDGSNGFRLDGTATNNNSGWSVSNAGDVNGDGFNDVIIGAQRADSSYLVFGKASGFSAAMDLSSLDGNTGFRMDGATDLEFTGISVSGLGDINGDGFDDLIIGSESRNLYDYGASPITPSFVVFGKVSGFDPTLNLSSLDGINGFQLDIFSGSGLAFAKSVSDAGDVNGDGYDDLIVGTHFPSAYHNANNGNASYVVFGKSSGFDSAFTLNDLDGSNGFRLDKAGADLYDISGLSVSSGGDINGDGFGDLIIGARTDIVDFYQGGASYVVFGKASGFSAALDLSALDGSDGFRLRGGTYFEYTGTSVSGAGDVNGDGFDDLVVGAAFADPNGSNSGSSYIIFGRSDFSGTVVTHPGTPGNDNLIGTQAAEVFDAGDGNDNMIGRGGADVFHAGAGDDNIRVSDLNFQLVEGGTGNDTLHLTGKDLNLDLSTIGDKIRGIETICLNGKGDNTLSITATGLINLSDSTNTLKVNGNAGDHIAGLSSGWTDEGARGNGYFHVYTQGDAVLLVGANVTTDFPVI